MIIKDWNELPIGKYIEIYDLTDDEDRALRIAAILGGITYDEIMNAPLGVTKGLLKNAEFLAKKPKIKRAKGEYVLNGETFIFNRDLNGITTAQFIDFDRTPKDLYHVPEIAAIFLIPSGHSYNDGYDMEHVTRTIRNYMSFEDYNAVSAFFLGSYLISMKRFEKETLKAMKKAVKAGVATREEQKQLKQNLQVIRAATLGYY